MLAGSKWTPFKQIVGGREGGGEGGRGGGRGGREGRGWIGEEGRDEAKQMK